MDNLPTEIAQGIAEQAFLPDSENDRRNSPYPVDDGPPDLTVMGVNHHFQAIFEHSVLPESVVIEVRQYLCHSCGVLYREELDDETPFLRTFSPANSEPWITLLNKASVVSIDVGCDSCTSQAPTSTTATIYRPGRGLSVLALSQLLMIQYDGQLKINMRCTPRSYRGAQDIVKFANALTKFVYGIDVGSVSIDAGALPRLPPGLLPEGLASITNKLRRPNNLCWTDAAPAHEVFLTECQRLLNQENVPIHQIAFIAEQAHKPTFYDTPDPDESSQMILADDLSDFMMTRINGGSML